MADVKKIIGDLKQSFGGSNDEQMKAVQLLKGLATSDDPEANKFMKALDKATTDIASDMTEGVREEKKVDHKKGTVTMSQAEWSKVHQDFKSDPGKPKRVMVMSDKGVTTIYDVIIESKKTGKCPDCEKDYLLDTAYCPNCKKKVSKKENYRGKWSQFHLDAVKKGVMGKSRADAEIFFRNYTGQWDLPPDWNFLDSLVTEEVIEVTEDVRLPKTDVILEKGDKIKVIKDE